MTGFKVIDLSGLPAPNVIEEIDYETLFKEYLSYFLSKDPGYDAMLESDPSITILQTLAYREMLLRSRINEASKANMLAYARGSDLDNLSAFYGVERLINEDDNRLRIRTQLALEGFSTAGPIGAYIFHSMSATPRVKSVNVESPEPGEVLITILGNEENGIVFDTDNITDLGVEFLNNEAVLEGNNIRNLIVKDLSGNITYTEGFDYLLNPENGVLTRLPHGNIIYNTGVLVSYDKDGVLSLVRNHLNEDDIRPLTDYITVQSASIIPYSVEAIITVYPGPSFAVVEDNCIKELKKFLDERHSIGKVVALSGIYDALHIDGVKKVELITPTADIETSEIEAAFCENINIQMVIG